jgi:DNA-directed RNA polymerase sigma subunit (sigma70/sigma32)
MINLVRDLRTLHKNKYELDADEFSILQRYLGIVIGTPETYKQIGETKQITKQRVEQIIKRALIKLNLKENGLQQTTRGINQGDTV